MYTYRKPKNAEDAIKLVEHAKVNVLWDITNKKDLKQSQVYFEMYKPIVFVYKNDQLVGAAHGKSQHGPTVIDLNDRDVTKSYNKLVLNEIDIELKQLELDF